MRHFWTFYSRLFASRASLRDCLNNKHFIEIKWRHPISREWIQWESCIFVQKWVNIKQYKEKWALNFRKIWKRKHRNTIYDIQCSLEIFYRLDKNFRKNPPIPVLSLSLNVLTRAFVWGSPGNQDQSLNTAAQLRHIKISVGLQK